jgi:hypothetical protein
MLIITHEPALGQRVFPATSSATAPPYKRVDRNTVPSTVGFEQGVGDGRAFRMLEAEFHQPGEIRVVWPPAFTSQLVLIRMKELIKWCPAPVWLLLIILLGLGLRLVGLEWGQGYSYFGQGDAIADYSVAVDYARGEAKAEYLGQPNFNAHAKLPGPLYTLFFFAGLRFGGSIEGVILAIILLNTAAVYLTYLLAERTLGPPCSLWAALFAATLPFPVYYSVSIYNPNVIPFLGGLLFLALWEVVRHDRSPCIFWVGLLLLVIPQFHMFVAVLLPAVVVVLLLSSTRLNVPRLLGGLLTGAFLYLPYLRGEMAHRWQNTLGMMRGFDKYGWGGLKALSAPLSLLTNWVPQWTRSADAYRQLGRACFGFLGVFLALNLLSAMVGALLVARAFYEVRAAMRGFWHSPRQVFSRAPGILFLAILVGVPLLCAAVSGRNFRSHYATILFPALWTLAGWGVAKWSLAPQMGRFFVAAVIVVTCGNVWFIPAMFHHQGVSIECGEVFIPSFRNLEAVYQQLKAHAGANRCVRVDAIPYLRGFPRRDEVHQQAVLLRDYVVVREKEFVLLSGQQTAPVIYTLCRADQVTRRDTAVAYRAHGIALIAASPPALKPPLP